MAHSPAWKWLLKSCDASFRCDMDASVRTIHIAAALIDDDAGRLLLVRKTGTLWFMQASGNIEGGEGALAALRRELSEEIGLSLPAGRAHLFTLNYDTLFEPAPETLRIQYFDGFTGRADARFDSSV